MLGARVPPLPRDRPGQRADRHQRRSRALPGSTSAIPGTSADARRAVGQATAVPLVEGPRNWFDIQLGGVVHKSDAPEALRYTIARWQGWPTAGPARRQTFNVTRTGPTVRNAAPSECRKTTLSLVHWELVHQHTPREIAHFLDHPAAHPTTQPAGPADDPKGNVAHLEFITSDLVPLEGWDCASPHPTWFDPNRGNVSFFFEYDIEGFVDRLFRFFDFHS